MARLTKREEREYVTTFCGINPSRFEVETIYEERGGMLWRSGGGEHYPLKGRRRYALSMAIARSDKCMMRSHVSRCCRGTGST